MKKEMVIKILIALIVLCLFIIVYLCLINNSNKEVKSDSKIIKEEIKDNEESKVEDNKEEKVDIEDNKEYQQLDIEEVIKKYDLEYIREYIDKDKDFFKQYAYAILNNDNISYKNLVLKMYKVVISNDKYLDKKYMIEGLNSLSIKMDDINAGIAYYHSGDNMITGSPKTPTAVFLHELMHFVDYKMSKPSTYFCYDNEKITYDGYCNKTYYYYSDNKRKFLVEGGADVNTFRYNDAITSGYIVIDNIYTVISYILGEQVMNDIYYSSKSFEDFVLELKKYNITIDEIDELFEKCYYISVESNFITGTSPNPNIKEIDVMVDIMSFISKLYKNKFNRNWEQDKEFSYLMRMLIRSSYNYTHYTDEKMNQIINNFKNMTNEEKELLTRNIDIEVINKQIKEYDIKLVFQVYNFFLKNGKIYIINGVNKNDKIEILAVEYDIEKEKVNNYYIIKRDEIS